MSEAVANRMVPKGAIVGAAALVGFALVAASVSSAAQAQSYPTHPITAIIPFAGGSASDVVSRILFERMSKSMGQPIIVENRSGASTMKVAPHNVSGRVVKTSMLSLRPSIVKTTSAPSERPIQFRWIVLMWSDQPCSCSNPSSSRCA